MPKVRTLYHSLDIGTQYPNHKPTTQECKMIDTLVFDYGGFIVNLDDAAVMSVLDSLGINALKKLLYASKIKSLVHQYINGLVPEEQTLNQMLAYCRKGVTINDMLQVLEPLCGHLPKDRLQLLASLRPRYRVFLLSNINHTLWQKSEAKLRECGYAPSDLFDGLFLSYAMHKAKPQMEIYQELTQQTGLDPAHTLYFDDRRENADAGRRFGFQSVFVKTNHLEDYPEWQHIVQEAQKTK